MIGYNKSKRNGKGSHGRTQNREDKKMTNLTVAKTIANQIGNQALFMLGAKNLMGDENSLSFRIGRNEKGVNLVKVTLEPSDTYTVRFFKVRGMDVKTIATEEDVYFDDLRPTLRRNTGMEVSLGTMGVRS